MTIVECPDCGEKVDSRGLWSHRGSRPCKANQSIDTHKGKGQVLCSERMANYLEGIGVDVEHDISGYTDGNQYRAGELSYGYWADEEEVEKAELEIMVGYAVDKGDKIAETQTHIAVEFDDGYFTFKKGNEGKTRKRVFKVHNVDRLREPREEKHLILFTIEGTRFGKLSNEIPASLFRKIVASRL